MSTAARAHPELEVTGPAARGRGWLWGGIVAAALLSFLWARPPAGDARARLAAIPLQGADFAGSNLTLDPAAQRVLGHVAYLHRRYVFAGREWYVTMIDGSQDRHVVHDPRYCFEGAGWQVAADRPLAIPGGNARQLALARDGGNLQAVFWFSDGASRHASVFKYWSQTVLRRLTLGHSGAEPVIVVIQSLDPAPDWNAAVPQLVDRLRL